MNPGILAPDSHSCLLPGDLRFPKDKGVSGFCQLQSAVEMQTRSPSMGLRMRLYQIALCSVDC